MKNAMEANALLSVIVPVYNAAQYLKKCLDSVSNQSYRNLEIICIDDGSTDNSGAILDEYAAKDSRFIVIHKANEGQAVARNLAIKQSRGEFFIALDADDYIHPDCYAQALSCMTEDVDWVYFDTNAFSDEQNAKGSLAPSMNPKYRGKYAVDANVLKDIDVVVWNKIFRRSLVDKYEIKFPENIHKHEDVAFCCQYGAVCRNIYFLNKKLYYYRVHSQSCMANTRKQAEGRFVYHLCVDVVYKFYTKNGLWEKMLPKVEQLAMKVSWPLLAAAPQQQKLRGKLIYHSWLRKWRLHEIFPNNKKIQEYANPSAIDLIQAHMEELLIPQEKAKEPQEPVIVVKTCGFCKCVPVMTVRCSCDPETGRKRKRIKLFGFLPLLYGKGTTKRMSWHLFNLIPIWYTNYAEERSE